MQPKTRKNSYKRSLSIHRDLFLEFKIEMKEKRKKFK